MRYLSYNDSGRRVPPRLSMFNIESYLYWILFSLQEEIIEQFNSLWFPWQGAPAVILHTLRPTEAIFDRTEVNDKTIFE